MGLPLQGLRVLELGGMGPAPFAGMMLADNGATGLRIVRPGTPEPEASDSLVRNRPWLAVDLKAQAGREMVLGLARAADIVIEGFRPGAIETLGLGPEVLHGENPRLTICRMTGWGQSGPLAPVAGHDLNFVSLSGALALMGPADRPPLPPLNLVGDFGGGMMCAFAALAGVTEARATGRGRVIDCAMLDAAAAMSAWIYAERAAGRWSDRRGGNQTDGSAPFYRTYETADGAHMAVAAIEPAFFRRLAALVGYDDPPEDHADPATWPETTARLEAIFRTWTQAEWVALLEGEDTCCTPVLAPGAAPGHPHNAARAVFREENGTIAPAPAPRYGGETPPARPAWAAGADDLAAWAPGQETI